MVLGLAVVDQKGLSPVSKGQATILDAGDRLGIGRHEQPQLLVQPEVGGRCRRTGQSKAQAHQCK